MPIIHTNQVIQVNNTCGGAVTCLSSLCLFELGGNSGDLKQPPPAGRMLRTVAVVVVVRLEVLLTDEHIVEHVERSVYVHVQGKQPLPQSLWVHHWKPMEEQFRAFE